MRPPGIAIIAPADARDKYLEEASGFARGYPLALSSIEFR
jgi:hypothetical protein